MTFFAQQVNRAERTKECFELRLGKRSILIVCKSTSLISKTHIIQSSRLVILNVCLRASLYEVWKPQGAEESYLTIFPVEFTVQLYREPICC